MAPSSISATLQATSSVQAATTSPHGFSSDSVSPAVLQSSRKNYTWEFKASVVFASTPQLAHTTNVLNFYTRSHDHVFFSSGRGYFTLANRRTRILGA